MRPDAIFEFSDVVVEREGLRALDRVTAVIATHGVTVIFGPSGSGKSTLMRLCNRLEVPHSGRVWFNGGDIAALDPLWLRQRVGMCFQRATPFRGTVRDNLRVARPDASDREMIDLLASVAMTGSWLDRDAATLSGGQAQRMCLARTLLARPEVLLLDEPTSAVDATATQVIEDAVRRLVDDHGIPVLWVTHDRGQRERVADAVIHLEHGRCVRREASNRTSRRRQLTR